MAFAPGCDQQCAAQSPPQHSSVFSLGCRALTYPADHPTNLADALLGVGPAGSASRGDLARNDPQLALVEHVVNDAVLHHGLASQDVVAIDVGHDPLPLLAVAGDQHVDTALSNPPHLPLTTQKGPRRQKRVTTF